MGTWSTEILGNDSAMDTLGDLAAGEFSFTELAADLQDDYIDSSAGDAVLALIEVALAVRGLRELPEDDVADAARIVLDDDRAAWLLTQSDRVLSSDSEVFELWQEASDQSFREWLGSAEAAVADLRRALEASAGVETLESAHDN
ncbi:DUF4259 domain-containing protein [Promicromonospora sp. MEB111]|uniref:DUF4259 domain-containing protein n=1 Tax=Promicromonospora sp. MEB111 TaxID=3040301 RepID=UPI0025509784|nr:DUF4259 domain-containing protein [Promicromonospora sp. MEB111]